MHCIEISKYIDAFILNPLGEHNRHCVLGNLGDCNFFQNDVTYLSDVTEKDAFFLFFDTREKERLKANEGWSICQRNIMFLATNQICLYYCVF